VGYVLGSAAVPIGFAIGLGGLIPTATTIGAFGGTRWGMGKLGIGSPRTRNVAALGAAAAAQILTGGMLPRLYSSVGGMTYRPPTAQMPGAMGYGGLAQSETGATLY